MSNSGRQIGKTHYLNVPLTLHYSDVIMGTVPSQITSLTIVYSTVYSDADQRKHQSSESLAFVRGINRGPVNSPHKWPVTGKMFPFDDVIMCPSLISIVIPADQHPKVVSWFNESRFGFAKFGINKYTVFRNRLRLWHDLTEPTIRGRSTVFKSLFRRTTRKRSAVRITGPVWEESNDAKSVSIWWRRVLCISVMPFISTLKPCFFHHYQW